MFVAVPLIIVVMAKPLLHPLTQAKRRPSGPLAIESKMNDARRLAHRFQLGVRTEAELSRGRVVRA